ncbi:MAG: NapC/NirT family cytochrome c [Desulfovibrio sp.]|jgi:cytochrome c nitrite reductase small subunit|nr:NapC/NirT family cytochrome c [Desulfovibrio sp.]
MGIPRNGPGLKCLLGGVAVGVAFVCVFWSAMASTDQRPFCASCHLMQEAAVTHKMGTHADKACNDCHTPQNFLAKIPFKAGDGLRDFMANVSGKDLPYPASTRTRMTVNENCKSCHAQTNTKVASMASKTYCVDCHRNVAHMRFKPVSTRMVAYEQ